MLGPLSFLPLRPLPILPPHGREAAAAAPDATPTRRIDRVRDEIRRGEYVTLDKLEAAAEKLLRDLAL